MLDLGTNLKNPERPTRCIIRLRTSTWKDSRGIHIKRSLIFLKSKSQGFNFLEEDINCDNDAVFRILNLDECQDGIYEVIMCDHYQDWETGIVEDWNYKLIPYET